VHVPVLLLALAVTFLTVAGILVAIAGAIVAVLATASLLVVMTATRVVIAFLVTMVMAAFAIRVFIHFADCSIGAIGIKASRLKVSAQPRDEFIVLGVAGFSEHLQQMFVAGRAAAIFGWASTLTADAERVTVARVKR
jgi:hypothetical protein